MQSDVQQEQEETYSPDSSSTSYDESGSESKSGSDNDNDSITPEYLASLLEKAKANIRERKGKQIQKEQDLHQESVLLLDTDDDDDAYVS